MSKSKRISNLDLFRFFAIFLVVYFHLSQMFLSQYFFSYRFFKVGALGVELFFVLSGFLVAGLYYKVKKEKINLRLFWLQRFLRTYPPYLAALIVSFLMVYFFRNEKFDFGYLVFLQNFYDKILFFKVSWSLCVEEHFYLLFVVFALITMGLSKVRIMTAWIIICLVPLVLRFVLGYNNYELGGFYKSASIFRIDGIAIGAFFAYIINNYTIKYKGKFINNMLLLIVLISIGLWISGEPSYLKYTVGYFLFVLNAALLMVSLYFSSPVKIGETYFVKQIALMAYSIYLTHPWVLNFFDILQKKLNINNFIAAIISLISILILGYTFYLIIEKPTIVMRNNLLNNKK